jgi:NifU-like protein involved in Fe-S cluster formation
MRYSELTRRYFESTARVGALPGAFRGAAGHREQGTWVQFDVRTDAAKVSDARFLAFGCPHTIAVAAWVAETSIGGPVRRDMGESVQALADRFAVPVEKLGRLFIVEDAWKAAVGAAIDSAARAPMSDPKSVKDA